MSSSEAAARPRQRSFWIAVICGAVILTIGMGARQSFGIFQNPIAADLKVGRELWSFANALAMLLWALSRPFSPERRSAALGAATLVDRSVSSPSCRLHRCCSTGSATGI